MQTCKEVIDLLTEYMEGDLPPDQARELGAHLALCPLCVEFLDSLRKTSAAARNLRVEEVPEECHRRLHAFLDAQIKKGRASS